MVQIFAVLTYRKPSWTIPTLKMPYNGYTRWPNNFDLRNKGLYLLKKEANLKGADLRHMVFQYNFDLRYSDLSYADI